jgi:hypothetical protein
LAISPRRLLATTSCGVLAIGLAWLPAAPASADTLAQFGVNGNAGTSLSCLLTSGDDSVSSTTGVFSHGKRTRSTAFDATFTNTGDGTDTVHASGHITGTFTLRKKGADLGKAALTATGAVDIDSAQGSSTACDPSASVSTGAEMEFTEHHAGWLYVERSTVSKPSVAEVVVQASGTGSPVVFDLYQGGASHSSTRGFVKPGTYGAAMVLGLTAGNAGVFTKAVRHSAASMVFVRAGSALTATKGSGKSYVEFPGSVSCGSHKATLRWKPSASKVAAGAFFVNGSKKASDSSPRGGEKIVLKHLKPKADVKITAKLKLKAGGSATASRAYAPCKG